LITSAAALLAGTVLAGAQENQRNQPAAQPGATQEHKAPAAQEHKAPAAQPQGQREQRTPAPPSTRAQDRNQGQRPSTTGQGQREEAPAQRPEQSQAPAERRDGKENNRRDSQDNNRRDRTQGQNDRDRREDGRNQGDDRRDRAQGQNDRNRRDEGRNDRDDRRQGQDNRNNNDNRERTQGQGPGRAGASVTLTTEQRTRIRETVLVGRNAPRVRNINFSIDVGIAVPRSVHLVTVPSLIVEYYPEWRGFLYFVYEDEIIVVDPRSHRIVAVLDV
jgi:hypothetical protein